MPAPLSGVKPSRTVRSVSDTVLKMAKIRLVSFGSKMVVAALAPTMSMSVVMSNWPEDRLYSPAGTLMVSVPAPAAHSPVVPPDAVSVFAEVTASRTEHNPSSATVSAIVVTLIVPTA